ncbi:hypothetical protein EAH87_03160 [Sphingomonas koreensis]|nr:hypothetical protein EAH87_03160 [Sphingomonas koreensis]
MTRTSARLGGQTPIDRHDYLAIGLSGIARIAGALIAFDGGDAIFYLSTIQGGSSPAGIFRS